METIRELAAKLGLDIDENAFDVADNLIGLVGKGLAGLGLVAGAAGLALAGMVGKTVATAGALSDLSARTGVDVEVLQRLGHAASLGGVSLEELAAGLNFASKKGVKDLPAFVGKVADEVARLNAAGKKSEAVAYAIEKLGKGGASLLPMLQGGAAGIAALSAEADALGLIMDSKLVEAGDELGDNFDKLKGSALGFAYSISRDIVPLLNEAAESALEWWKANRKEVVEGARRALEAVGKVIAWVWNNAVKPLGAGLKLLAENWQTVAVVLGSFVTAALIANSAAVATAVSWYGALAVASVLAAVKAAAAWAIALWPVVLLGAAIAAVILIAQDLWTTFNGGEGVIYGLLEAWTKFWGGVLEDDPDDIPFVQGLKWTLRQLADIEGALGRLYDNTLGPISKWLDDSGLSISSDVDARAGNAAALSLANGGQLFDAGGASSPAAAASLQTSAQAKAAGGDLNLGGMTIVQQPGESSDDLSKRVRFELEDFWETKNRETAAALGEG